MQQDYHEPKDYDLTSNTQYLVEHTDSGKHEIMEWKVSSFRNYQDELFFLGSVIPVREATKAEKILIRKLSKHVNGGITRRAKWN